MSDTSEAKSKAASSKVVAGDSAATGQKSAAEAEARAKILGKKRDLVAYQGRENAIK